MKAESLLSGLRLDLLARCCQNYPLRVCKPHWTSQILRREHWPCCKACSGANQCISMCAVKLKVRFYIDGSEDESIWDGFHMGSNRYSIARLTAVYWLTWYEPTHAAFGYNLQIWGFSHGTPFPPLIGKLKQKPGLCTPLLLHWQTALRFPIHPNWRALIMAGDL